MAIAAIDHYTILTKDLDATRHFYCNVLGLTEGWRPPFSFPGIWLYAGGHPIVHVIAGREFQAGGTGAVDHLAFLGAGDPDDVAKRIKAAGVQVSARVVPGTKIRQLFCTDPNGVRLELNFPMG